MTIFTVTITDLSSLTGVTRARNSYNAALPRALDNSGKVISPTPGTLNTDNDYIQMVVNKAAESYAKSYGLIITAAQKTAMQNSIATATVVD